jgi:hypothetical protein
MLLNFNGWTIWSEKVCVAGNLHGSTILETVGATSSPALNYQQSHQPNAGLITYNMSQTPPSISIICIHAHLPIQHYITQAPEYNQTNSKHKIQIVEKPTVAKLINKIPGFSTPGPFITRFKVISGSWHELKSKKHNKIIQILITTK